ncbi:MAG: Kef-type K+ transport system membrane component KefB [Myxococcota bacterium]|jgi:Kef-type K+ transport system membrane component KefB
MTELVAIPLILITLGAILMPGVARSIGIPVAVMEILYGLLIGRSGLGLIPNAEDPFITFLSEVGFAFFLFLAGLEIDFRTLEKAGLRKNLLPLSISMFAFAMSIFISTQLGWGLWVGLATGATSVPLLLAVVRELRLSTTAIGGTMITVAAMGEAVTILLLSLVELQQEAETFGDIAAGVGRLAALIAAMFVVVILLRTLLWWYPRPFYRMVSEDDPAEVGVRVGFGLMFAFIGLSMLAHVEPFLGAFIAGAILAYIIREKGALEHKLSSMGYGFFVPVFFIHVGIRLEDLTPALLFEHGGWIASIIGVMLLVKLVPGMLLLRRGMNMRVVLATCGLLAAPLTLVIAIMDIGMRVHAIDSTTNTVVITAGIIASLLFPSAARRLLSDVDTPDPQNQSTGHG